jgi:hypothetical protein
VNEFNWYRFDGVHQKLDILTDDELARLRERHYARVTELERAGEALASEEEKRRDALLFLNGVSLTHYVDMTEDDGFQTLQRDLCKRAHPAGGER